MRFTLTTVFLGFVAASAACAIPLGVDSSADALRARASPAEVQASSDDPTAALFLPLNESSPGHHPSSRGLPLFKAPIDITYKESNGPRENYLAADKALQKAKELLKSAASKLETKVERFDGLEAANMWKGSLAYVEFTFELGICKGKCTAIAFGQHRGRIYAQDGKELYAR